MNMFKDVHDAAVDMWARDLRCFEECCEEYQDEIAKVLVKEGMTILEFNLYAYEVWLEMYRKMEADLSC